MSIQNDFSDILGTLNASYTKWQVYYEDWESLPSGVKDIIKADICAKIDNAITGLTVIKDDINGV